MRLIVMALATLGLAVQASAAPPVLIVTTGGYFLMTKDANGVPVAQQCTVVLMDAPPTGDPDGPKPPISNTVADAIYASADAVGDTEGAKGLSVFCQQISKMIGDGTLKTANAGKAIELGWPLVLAKMPGSKKSAWKATYDTLENLAVSEAQAGRLSSAGDWRTFLGSVSAGLDRAAGPDSAFDLAAILAIIMQIIEFLKLLGLF